jgi:hypothetical protein
MPGLAHKMLAAGLSIGGSLGLAEAALELHSGGAFPVLNLFEPDPRYGVTLQRNAKTRVRRPRGGVVTIATNGLGFRGAEWPAGPAILLTGDSQMLGYNVEQEQTVSAELGRRGIAVLNAAVPSWGPPEYAEVVEELAPIHRPSAIVFVANLANDWVEAEVPNRLRSDAEDGWLILKEPHRAPAIDFPGRRFLFGRSQLVFLLRELWTLPKAFGAIPRGRPIAQAPLAMLRAVETLRRSAPDGARSVITPALLRVAEASRRVGAKLLLVVLPMDVQVDPTEWSKYGTPPRDLSALAPLTQDLLADARDHGIAAIDLLPALRARSPGAFLSDDYHLSPAGHAAVAEALFMELSR